MAISYRGTGALFALLLVFAPNAAGAEDAKLAAFKQANAAIREALSHAKTPPSMKDPAYAKQVSQAFDIGVVDGIKDEPAPAVLAICTEAIRTTTSYLLFGIQKEDVPDPNPNHAGPQLAEKENANYLRFQDEVTAAVRFGLPCTARVAEKMDALVAQLKPSDMTPVRRAGLQQTQQGLVNSVSGGASSILDSVRPSNRGVVLTALVRNLDPLTAAMSKASRQAALNTVDPLLWAPGLSRDEREKLLKVQKALNRTDCGRVCAFH